MPGARRLACGLGIIHLGHGPPEGFAAGPPSCPRRSNARAVASGLGAAISPPPPPGVPPFRPRGAACPRATVHPKRPSATLPAAGFRARSLAWAVRGPGHVATCTVRPLLTSLRPACDRCLRRHRMHARSSNTCASGRFPAPQGAHARARRPFRDGAGPGGLTGRSHPAGRDKRRKLRIPSPHRNVEGSCASRRSGAGGARVLARRGGHSPKRVSTAVRWRGPRIRTRRWRSRSCSPASVTATPLPHPAMRWNCSIGSRGPPLP